MRRAASAAGAGLLLHQYPRELAALNLPQPRDQPGKCVSEVMGGCRGRRRRRRRRPHLQGLQLQNLPRPLQEETRWAPRERGAGPAERLRPACPRELGDGKLLPAALPAACPGEPSHGRALRVGREQGRRQPALHQRPRCGQASRLGFL